MPAAWLYERYFSMISCCSASSGKILTKSKLAIGGCFIDFSPAVSPPRYPFDPVIFVYQPAISCQGGLVVAQSQHAHSAALFKGLLLHSDWSAGPSFSQGREDTMAVSSFHSIEELQQPGAMAYQRFMVADEMLGAPERPADLEVFRLIGDHLHQSGKVAWNRVVS
jgi:hypothetical protein